MKKNAKHIKIPAVPSHAPTPGTGINPHLLNLALTAAGPNAAVALQSAADAYFHRDNSSLSSDYRKNVHTTVSAFVRGFPPATVLTVVQPSMIQDFLDGNGPFANAHGPWEPATKRTALGHIWSFFSWALPHFGFHQAPNPAKSVQLPPVWREPFEPLDLDESQRLMDSRWEFHGGVYIPRLLLEGWGSLRRAELDHLRMDDLDLERGCVIAHSFRFRRVELAPATILIFRVLQERGCLSEKSLHPSDYAVREMNARANLAPGRMRAALLRRTGIFYYFAQCGDLCRTASWGDVNPMLLDPRHFPKVDPHKVEGFWAMLPSELRATIPSD